MKARRITTKKEWQRISEAVEEFSREKHIFTVYKIFALFAIALNELYGFGRVRLCRLIFEVSKQSLSYDSFEEIKDIILDRCLRDIKMDELADTLNEEREKLDAYIGD